MSGFVPSHYLVRTVDLPGSVARCREAGFTVVWGSDPETAYNAMIYLRAGGFIELFDPPMDEKAIDTVRAGAERGDPMMQRYHRWATGAGFCDFALETSESLADAVAGKNLPPLRPATRVRADGVTTARELCTPPDAELPFMMGPYDPPEDLGPEKTGHANGAGAVVGLQLDHPNPVDYAERLQTLLGPCPMDAAGNGVTLTQSGFSIRIDRADAFAHRRIVLDRCPDDWQSLGLAIEPAGSRS